MVATGFEMTLFNECIVNSSCMTRITEESLETDEVQKIGSWNAVSWRFQFENNLREISIPKYR